MQDDVDSLKLLRKDSSSLEKKFNLELSALLNDDCDDENTQEKAEGGVSLIESKASSKNRKTDIHTPNKGYKNTAMKNRLDQTSLQIKQTADVFESADTVEVPDYSPDFNSESEKISQEEMLSEINARCNLAVM